LLKREGISDSAHCCRSDENAVLAQKGKAAEYPNLYERHRYAKKNLKTVFLRRNNSSHEIIGEYGAARVLLKPAAPGTGVIAGGTVRAVLDLAGIKDIRTKCLGSHNAVNLAKATIDGLAKMMTAEEVSKKRNKSVEEILG
jgi:small subunit ribosomal protein S5